MAVLPTGTVTFLFTDIESSTRLWDRHPDAMPSALAGHDAIVRDAIEDQGGVVFATSGDGFAAAFAGADRAVAATITAQLRLQQEEWPAGVELRVRMGLHAGAAEERDGDYFGPTVNHTARLMAAAHGGQVLCSSAAAELVSDRVELLDLGVHRLRDLESVTHIWQVVGPGLPSVFPPLRTLDAFRSNLPHDLSVFIGRDEHVETVVDALRHGRVVSIVGVGGVGKTRLALRVGAELLPEFTDGVWLCELANVREPEELPDAVAAALGVIPAQGLTVTQGLCRFFAAKQLLLILDNCEHLLGAVAGFVTDTCAAAAKLAVLTTSREALALRGEHTHPLPSLALPLDDAPATIAASEAGALFVDRARDVRGDFTVAADNANSVRELLVRLDGIPLAIELAAARTMMMSPAEILGRLDQRFRLLTGGSRTARERHQTLRAAIDWSYEMLDAGERRLLGRLAVFVGDFDLDAAVALAAGADLEEFRAVDALGGLVAKSLVERNEAGGTTRYRLLEMIRQYAAEHLDADGDADDARDEHSRYYLNRTAELFAQLSTPDDFAAIDALQAETPNLAAAGRWLVDARRAAELLAFFARVNWIDYGSLPFVAVEDLGRLGRAAADTPGASRRPGFAEACYAAGMQAFYAGDLDGFRHFAELADTAPGERPACTTIGLAGSLSMHGDLSAAVPIAQAAVDHARHRRDRVSLAFLLGALASFEAATMDSAASVPHAREAVEIARATGAQSGLVFALYALANAQRYTEPDRALAVAEECVRIDRTQRRTWSNACRSAAAAVYIEQGDLGRALDLCRAGLQHFHWIGDRTQISVQLAVISEALAPVDASLAVQLAAIGESGAIAAYPFIDNPMMKNLAGAIEELGRDALEAERARAATMSYDDAIAFVFETLDGFTTRAAGP